MVNIKAKKLFVVVAYDISNTNNRSKVAKLLEKYGTRINLSVFECMITKAKLSQLRKKIDVLINPKTDSIVYYTLCVDCYCKIERNPETKTAVNQVFVV